MFMVAAPGRMANTGILSNCEFLQALKAPHEQGS